MIQSSPVTVPIMYHIVLEGIEDWQNLINGEVGLCQCFATIQITKGRQVGRLIVFRPLEWRNCR